MTKKITKEKATKQEKENLPKDPFYTNSSQLPVGYTDDLFEAVELQDPLQTKYTGGCIEKGNKILTNKGLLNIEYIVKQFKKLRPIKAVSYNIEKEISEWDEIVNVVTVNVKKKNKIRIKGERSLDIVTSDWHPFFVLKKIGINPSCPVCAEKVGNVKGFAAHVRWNIECREEYEALPKYKVTEKRADELKIGDYILQNSNNLYPEKPSKLDNDLMWLFGFFIGDGCISEFTDNRGKNNLRRYKIRFFSEHQKALEKVAHVLNKYFNCQVNVIQNEKRSKLLKEVSTSKREAWEIFFEYGFKAGKKTYNISVPQKVKKNITKYNVFSFLSGLMDSDGHINKRDGDFEYYTVSPRLADDILEICSMAGIVISKTKKITKRKNEVDIYKLRISQYQMTEMKDKLTNIINPLWIKENFSNRKKRHLPIARVKEISKVDIENNEFYDLTTRKNHNYLAGKDSLVFIHNTVLHAFLGEKLPSGKEAKMLVKKIFDKAEMPYLSITPTFSICPNHGYLSGEHFTCPKCLIDQPCEVYSRVVGYLRPVQQWNKGKVSEYARRKVYKVKK
jgi:ribonucleoside-triphosphate reductase